VCPRKRVLQKRRDDNDAQGHHSGRKHRAPHQSWTSHSRPSRRPSHPGKQLPWRRTPRGLLEEIACAAEIRDLTSTRHVVAPQPRKKVLSARVGGNL
jgi:hypothetical protein